MLTIKVNKHINELIANHHVSDMRVLCIHKQTAKSNLDFQLSL